MEHLWDVTASTKCVQFVLQTWDFFPPSLTALEWAILLCYPLNKVKIWPLCLYSSLRNTTTTGNINSAQRSCHWVSLNKHIQVQDSKRHSHLLSLWLASTSSSSAGTDGAVRSSKLMMYRQMSSTSLLIGAITSLQRNFVPEGGQW